MRLLKQCIIAAFILMSSVGIAQELPQRPNPPKLVNDLAGLLTDSQEKELEFKLRYFNDTTSNQILIITVNTLNGYEPAPYAYALGEKWGVGQKDFNNGIVLLVKPKTSNSDKGQAFIAIGYGLEPVIPDATSKKIVENEMIPNFKNEDYYGGIDQATDVLMKLASGEISAKGYNKGAQAPWFVGLLPFFAILIIFLLMSRSQKKSYGMGSNNSLWTALFLGSMLGNRSHGGSWNNFSGGSSGFGGGGGSSGFGGGFSGFGGGSFGGGGAGGSW